MATNAYLDFYRVDYQVQEDPPQEGVQVYIEYHEEGDPPHSASATSTAYGYPSDVSAFLSEFAIDHLLVWKPM